MGGGLRPDPPGSAVIMWTGFEDRWDDPAAYLNADPAGGLHYPGFGAEVARWLIQHRSIGALGIDAMGIDPGADTSFRTNQLLLQEHRIHLENLAGLGEMPAAGSWVIVGGIRLGWLGFPGDGVRADPVAGPAHRAARGHANRGQARAQRDWGSPGHSYRGSVSLSVVTVRSLG